MADSGTLTARLRKWTRHHDPHVRAAVELLIWHVHWLNRTSFLDACVRTDRDGASWISWAEAREFLNSSPRASSSELAILDLAIAIGTDQYRLSRMGHQHSRAIITAVAAAVVEPVTFDG